MHDGWGSLAAGCYGCACGAAQQLQHHLTPPRAAEPNTRPENHAIQHNGRPVRAGCRHHPLRAGRAQRRRQPVRGPTSLPVLPAGEVPVRLRLLRPTLHADPQARHLPWCQRRAAHGGEGDSHTPTVHARYPASPPLPATARPPTARSPHTLSTHTCHMRAHTHATHTQSHRSNTFRFVCTVPQVRRPCLPVRRCSLEAASAAAARRHHVSVTRRKVPSCM